MLEFVILQIIDCEIFLLYPVIISFCFRGNAFDIFNAIHDNFNISYFEKHFFLEIFKIVVIIKQITGL